MVIDCFDEETKKQAWLEMGRIDKEAARMVAKEIAREVVVEMAQPSILAELKTYAPKWEYKLIYCYTDRPDVEFLNQLGLEGWENYTVVRSSDENLFFLKRPKVE